MQRLAPRLVHIQRRIIRVPGALFGSFVCKQYNSWLRRTAKEAAASPYERIVANRKLEWLMKVKKIGIR